VGAAAAAGIVSRDVRTAAVLAERAASRAPPPSRGWVVQKLRPRTSREVDAADGGEWAGLDGDRLQLFQGVPGKHQGTLSYEYHLRNISMATEILDCLRFTYVFESWYPSSSCM
jgi:hypothetical protein